MLIEAFKYHGYGNDFFVVRANQLEPREYRPFSQAICTPHFGLGADGCIFLEGFSDGRFPVRIFNRDGTEAKLSGNGVRCAAGFIHHHGLTDKDQIDFQTGDGLKIYHLIEGKQPLWIYRCYLGEPGFDPDRIPFKAESGYSFESGQLFHLEERDWIAHPLWVGNPQAAVFVDVLPEIMEVRRLGLSFQQLVNFPEGTNVSFIRVEDDHTIFIRIWERGVGPTWSSGTGSSGAAVASILTGRVKSPVLVQTDSGEQEVAWQPGSQIQLTGEVRFVAKTEFFWQG